MIRSDLRVFAAAAVLTAALLPLRVDAQTCAAGWESAAAVPGVAGRVRTLAVHDLGDGPRLYVGGSFFGVGGTAAKNLARLGPAGWESIGDVDGYAELTEVNATAVFDDGSGPALFVAGVFATAGGVPATSVAKWNGTSWSALGAASFSGRVRALATFDDGTGPALYAGGEFQNAAGIVVNGLARWDGAAWSAVGAGFQQLLTFGALGHGHVYALKVASLPAGPGPRLYVAGVFTLADGIPATGFASYGPGGYQPCGAFSPPSTATTLQVRAFAEHDFGAGNRLVVGGVFTSAGGVVANDLVAFDGATISAVPAGLGTGSGADGVYSLASSDAGGVPALYAGGAIVDAAARRLVRRLVGTQWSTIAALSSTSGIAEAEALAAAPAGVGPYAGAQVWMGGAFSTIDGQRRPGLLAYDGAAVSAAADGFDAAVGAAAAAAPGGGAERLFVGGSFTTSTGGATLRVAAFDGTTFSALGAGVDGDVRALVRHDDGSGEALYAGGAFANAGGGAAAGVARWDGAAWTPLGAGCVGGPVTALYSMRNAATPTLVAGGRFTTAGGLPAKIAAWSNGVWTPLAASFGLAVTAEVRAMIEFDDGTGPALYVGGDFTFVDSALSWGVARLRAGAWEGLNPVGPFTKVNAFAVFDDGSGPKLYCAADSGGVYRWNGALWTLVAAAPGWVPASGTTIKDLAVFDDGGGERLYAVGNWNMNDVFGQPIRATARYDGAGWEAVGGYLRFWQPAFAATQARRFAVSATGGVERLYVGGSFDVADAALAGSLAGWTRRTPRIASGPAPATASLGGGATFAVSAYGPGLSYQWTRDGVAVPGATGPSLTIGAATSADFARYGCAVSNACGFVDSPAARLSCAFAFAIGQPYGPGSLAVANAAGIPGAAYFTAATFLEPANATATGLGPWFGLFVDPTLLFAEWASQAPPFVGALDGGGASWFDLPAGTIAGLAGAPLYGVSILYDPLSFEVLGTSPVAGTTLN